MMAPLIIFMVIVAPIWLVLHYRSKRQISQGLSEEELALLRDLSQRADRFGQRLETLERLMDAPVSGEGKPHA
ncbi:MAG: envelope stress response membrane protein PspB [Corallincola sp.]|nr:envelope stress response membrane protein PspB [Corallincola sp.]